MQAQTIFCSNCGKPIAATSQFCQYCGTPVRFVATAPAAAPAPATPAAPAPARGISCWIPILAVLGLLLLISFIINQRTPKTAYIPTDLDAYAAAEVYVTDGLKAPTTAKFPYAGDPSVNITHAGYVYTVRGYVDSQNSFGAMIRTQFVATVEWEGGDSGNWKAAGVQFS